MLPTQSMINNNESKGNNRNYEIPSLKDIEDRFYDIDKVSIYVHIDHKGYLREINSTAPFTGVVSIKKIINLLNKDINVVITNDSDLVKLRNFIIFYNEYFVPNLELNVDGYISAPIAFDRIESQFIRRFNKRNDETQTDNPFVNDLVKEFTTSYDGSDADDVFEQYIRRKKEEDKKISLKSAKMGGISNEIKPKEPLITMHSRFCRNMPKNIILPAYDKRFEDCEFI